MYQHQDIPDNCKEEPGEEEGGGEAEQCPGPGQVNHRGKKIFQVPRYQFLGTQIYILSGT